MRSYRWFIAIFTILLILYIIVEANRPEPVNWSLSLSKDDKIPYGGYVLYHQLKDIFPRASIQSTRLPVYNQLYDPEETGSAYLLVAPDIDLSQEDVTVLKEYVRAGNYAFIASLYGNRLLLDSLDQPRDTTGFIKMPYGRGAFFIHTMPVYFTNYYLLSGDSVKYAEKALSYIPSGVHKVYWDEYYKLGPEGSNNPMRFILGNPWLKWSYRIALITLLLFVLFEMKRRQRIIPVIEPLKNTTLDFVQTVGNVYFNRRDNKNIAGKKISYFLEWVRSKFFIDTNNLNDEFAEALSKKSGVERQQVAELLTLIHSVQLNEHIGDNTLLLLNRLIDNFYKNAK